MNSPLGKLFIGIGFFFICVGLVVLLYSKYKVPFLGRLPGDIFIKKDNFVFYFPLTTSLLVSAIISLIFFFISKR